MSNRWVKVRWTKRQEKLCVVSIQMVLLSVSWKPSILIMLFSMLLGPWLPAPPIQCFIHWFDYVHVTNCFFYDYDYNFYCATVCVMAVFADVRSVSVRPSVTFVYCIQMAEDIVKLLSRPGSPIILIFWPPASIPNSKENPDSGSANYTEVGKFCDFRLKSPFISKTVRDRLMDTVWYGMVYCLTSHHGYCNSVDMPTYIFI